MLSLVGQGDRTRRVGADDVTRHDVIGPCLTPRSHPRRASTLIRFRSATRRAICIGPDAVLRGPASISTPSSLGSASCRSDRSPGSRPRSTRAGAREVNAGPLAEAVDVQAADGDARAGDRQAVAAAGLAAVSSISGVPA